MSMRDFNKHWLFALHYSGTYTIPTQRDVPTILSALIHINRMGKILYYNWNSCIPMVCSLNSHIERTTWGLKTSHHNPASWTLGYNICTTIQLQERKTHPWEEGGCEEDCHLFFENINWLRINCRKTSQYNPVKINTTTNEILRN